MESERKTPPPTTLVENLKKALNDGMFFTVKKVEIELDSETTARVFDPAKIGYNGFVETAIDILRNMGFHPEIVMEKEHVAGLIYYVPYADQEKPEWSRKIENLARLLTRLDAWEVITWTEKKPPQSFYDNRLAYDIEHDEDKWAKIILQEQRRKENEGGKE